MIIIAYRSRSSQIAAAARLLALSWIASLQFWMLFEDVRLILAFIVLDGALACAFFQMTRGKWFPVPLFFLHAMLVVYHLYTALNQSDIVWIAVFLNRAFETAVFYVIACAAYRIYALNAHGAARR